MHVCNKGKFYVTWEEEDHEMIEYLFRILTAMS